MSTPDALKYRADIDGLRAVAVLAVVAYHLTAALAPGGYVGVDVFFVISGFLIFRIVWDQLEAGRFSMREFYARRVLRLLPASVFMVAVVLLASAFIELPSDFARLGRQVTSTMAYASNLWFWRNTGYFDPSSETMPLLHTWSLSVEEQFYMLAPLTLLALHRFARRWAWVAALVGFVGTLVASEYFLKSRQPAVFFLTPFRTWEFLCGGALSIARPKPLSRGVGLQSWLGVALIVGSIALLDARSDFPGIAAIAPCVGAALLLWAPPNAGVVRRALESAPVVAVGRVSYSLYLWHWPVFVLWNNAHPVEGERPVWQQVVKVGLAVALSVFSYRIVEQPLRSPQNRRRTIIGVLSVSAALLVGGLAVSRSGGVPARFAPQVAALDKAREPEVPFVSCFTADAPAGGDCHLGTANTPPTTLLWGDSHSLALAPAVDEALKHRGEAATFIATSTCPPGFGLHSRDVRQGDWKCERAQARVTKALEQTPTLRCVVLAGIWESYLASVSSVKLGDAQGEHGNPEVFLSTLEQTIDTLTERGLSVVFVNQVPKYARSVPEEMARSLATGRAPRLALKLSEVRERVQPVEALLKRLSTKGRVSVVDLPAVFCPDGECHYEAQMQPWYRDAHHLNQRGALVATPAVEAAVAECLASAAR